MILKSDSVLVFIHSYCGSSLCMCVFLGLHILGSVAGSLVGEISTWMDADCLQYLELQWLLNKANKSIRQKWSENNLDRRSSSKQYRTSAGQILLFMNFSWEAATLNMAHWVLNRIGKNTVNMCSDFTVTDHEYSLKMIENKATHLMTSLLVCSAEIVKCSLPFQKREINKGRWTDGWIGVV